LKRVTANVFAAAVLAATVFLPVSSLTAHAEANPNNHGHHYGQLKHRHLAPAPAPKPVQKPVLAAVPTPASRQPQSDPAAVKDEPAAVPAQLVPAAHINVSRSALGGGNLDWLLLVVLPALLAIWLMLFARAVLTASRRRRPTTAP